MKKLYISEVTLELEKMNLINQSFTEDDIKSLPAPVQKYFRYCGYIGKQKMLNAKIVFKDVDFISNGKELKLRSEQYNFVSKPTRLAYLNSKVMGIISFEGRDKYQNGKGSMIGKVMKIITLFNVTGPEMNQSALVTFLAEALIVPNAALQDYIKWKEINDNQAKAIMTYGGISVEGIFTFNDKGEFIRFETNDRYMDKGNGVMEKEKWTAEVHNYIEKDGIKVPGRMKGIWNLSEDDLLYFDGYISNISFNNCDINELE
ncbi:MAG: hypothetical protein FH762_08190 [Firmicutes bacterium]|nr:hypothetical protein [Bacillota bacterium]